MSHKKTASRHAIRRLIRTSALTTLGLGLLLSGCRTVHQEWDVPTGPAFRPTNFSSVGAIPAQVRRVAVLPLHAEAWEATTIRPVEAAFVSELQKFERFEVVSVSRVQMREEFGAESVISSAALPADVLARLRASQGADAILFQDLTHYAPYQPISIGVRAKLVSTIDGTVLWSFDTLFDGAQPSVAVAARGYYLTQGRPAHPLENSSGIMQSPSRFAKYVAHAMFGTLPPRQTR